MAQLQKRMIQIKICDTVIKTQGNIIIIKSSMFEDLLVCVEHSEQKLIGYKWTVRFVNYGH